MRRQQIAQQSFVLGVHIGIQQADGDRLEAARCKRRHQVARGAVEVYRGQDRAVGEDPFGDLEARRARDDGIGLLVLQIIDVVAAMALEDENIAEALRRDERRRKSLSLEHGIGGDGRSVGEVLDRPEGYAALDDGVDRAKIRRLRDTGNLGNADAVRPDRNQVRERATHLDADAHATRFLNAPAEGFPKPASISKFSPP